MAGYSECDAKFFEQRGFIYSKMRRYKVRMTAILVGNSRVLVLHFVKSVFFFFRNSTKRDAAVYK